MKSFFLNRYLLLLLSICFFYNSQGQKVAASSLQRVIIIRHGEKPDDGEHLSCRGQNRALQLANVLYAKFKTPDYIFVPALKTGKSTSQARMYETIVPFAVKYNLNIDTKYGVDDAAGVAASILKKTGTVLVVWEHNNIPGIVKALGVKDEMGKWKGEDFDSILIITFQNGKATLSRDKENINPSSACQ